jgi:plastocyanin
MRARALARIYAFALMLVTIPIVASVTGAEQKHGSTTVYVRIKDLAFVPKIIHVHVGTTVVWTNEDGVDHTVTSGTTWDNGVWKSSPLIPGGKQFSVKFNRPGSFPYYCKPHIYNDDMHGAVIVEKN